MLSTFYSKFEYGSKQESFEKMSSVDEGISYPINLNLEEHDFIDTPFCTC